MVTVYYATTRADLPFAKFANGFDGVDLRYGTAEVEVGNELFAPEPKILTETKWTTSGEEVLVFVHGFNNTFADAVQAGARLKQGLEWPGPLIVFSWASWGQVVLYTKDETLQAAAVTPFVGFLQGLEAASKVHILAHSMGNRIAVNALAMLPARTNIKLGQLMFAAADMDAAAFIGALPLFDHKGEGHTLYCNSKDAALGASSVIHVRSGERQFRAGQAWPVLVVENSLLLVPDVPFAERVPYVLMRGIDSIDCSDLAFGLGPGESDVHSYFQEAPTLNDIKQVLLGKSVQDRMQAGALQQVSELINPAGLRQQAALAADTPAGRVPPVEAGVVWWRLNPPVAVQTA